MSALELAAIDEMLAALTRVAPTPSAPYGYGTDISCRSDLDPLMADVDPNSLEALVQALVRRLDTPRGSLPDDPDAGISLRSYLNRGTTRQRIGEISAEVRGELLKDDRVVDVRVTTTLSADGRALGIVLDIVPADPTLGPFRLTLAVTDAAVLIEEVRSIS